jgi:protein-tyrosine phosphatase
MSLHSGCITASNLDYSLLLHTETTDGAVVPVWEEVQPENVMVLKDVMSSRRESVNVSLQYIRVPITAEKTPDYADLHDLIEVTLRTSLTTPIVVNCQLGRGRSTLASVCDSVLVQAVSMR